MNAYYLKALALGILVYMGTPVFSAGEIGFSLMFKADEIKETLESHPVSRKQTILNGLFLSGIIYQDPSTWVIWLNEKRYYPGDSMEGIAIQKVTPTSVDLVWEREHGHHFVHLLTNQVYDGDTGQIHCGDCRVKGAGAHG